jgi:DNA-binding NtrC family response regulator
MRYDDMERGRVLIIDDEEGMRRFLCDCLQEVVDCDVAKDGDEGIRKVQSEDFDLVISDLKMPGTLSGIALVKAILGLSDAPEVVVLTAYGTVQEAVEAMKAGALDFIEKPLRGLDEVRLIVRNALEKRRLARENERLKAMRAKSEEEAVVRDEGFKRVLDIVEKVAPTDTTVLILGESGVGKEVVAREVHRLRFGQGKMPFVAINCSAVPEQLFESEVFGHEKGAFTGAVERKVGVLEIASPGTLFFDEVAEMPLSLQAKLLRVLETREFKRVGGVKALKTMARFIFATNKDLEKEVREKRFREDLYYRISVFPIHVPPLRERPKATRALAKHFVTKFADTMGKKGLRLSESALDALQSHDWPGNIRELKNVIERAVIIAEGEEIDADDLALPKQGMFGGAEHGLLSKLERETILKCLEEVKGNRKLCAKKLGISLRTLQYRLKEYGIGERS